MTAVLLFLLICGDTPVLECSLGVETQIDYGIPEEYTPMPVQGSEDFSLLEQRDDTLTIVPLALDTLDLPVMTASFETTPSDSAGMETVEVEFPPPVVVAVRTMPDTVWTVPVFQAPLGTLIPPGFPRDYLERHAFWKKWQPSPSRWWVAVIALAAASLAAAALLWFYYRKRGRKREPEGEIPSDLSPVDEVEALLESSAFAQGRWEEYYKKVDVLLRDTVAFRFGITNRALTWRQILRRLSRNSESASFADQSGDLTREITLQRYAGWGGSRERAKRYTMKLKKLREEWHVE
ncbi:MAG: hypothetical protein GF388_03750 [Candidatus Aegiribacteria sp.]|nr:hypothetical protein [Candidatus Aegiribacteria sp.]MBD3294368.1 hypothetical protein [Candidatus Fermentibacteria bacterium]